jgi:AcrR family transcriptional regulator
MSASDDATTQTEASAPAGREQVTGAVLAATERLSATGQPSSFTVRQIAAEAGVTTSLLYFYFKSKDDIILATVRSISAKIDAAVAGHEGVGDISSATSRMLAAHPAFPRLLAWLVLEGRSFSELSDDPFLNRLARMFAVDDSSDPDTDAGAVVTMLLGNALFRGDINAALGRRSDDERLNEALDRARVAFALKAAKQSPAEAPTPE